MTFRDPDAANSSLPSQRIAVFRALQLGDMLCAVPALRALRAAYPDSEIVLIGLPWARQFAARYSCYIDGFIAFPGHPALPERVCNFSAVPAFLRAVHVKKFDLAIQMHGNGTVTNALLSWFGAARVAGFHPPSESCPDPRSFFCYPDNGPELRRLLDLAVFLGGREPAELLEFPLYEADHQELAVLATDLQPGGYVCIHAGSRADSRRWLPEYFAHTADALAAEGLPVVFTGTYRERGQVETISAMMKSTARNLAGRTTLGSLAALLAGARLLICNDTGVSHLATALSVPSVVVFTGSDPSRWAPLNRARHKSLVCPSPDQVVSAARSQLQESHYAA